jgi:hypothetical protein
MFHICVFPSIIHRGFIAVCLHKAVRRSDGPRQEAARSGHGDSKMRRAVNEARDELRFGQDLYSEETKL